MSELDNNGVEGEELNVVRRMAAPNIEAQEVNKGLDYSRNLDIHLWSDHPDVERLVNDVYEMTRGAHKANDWKRHIKVLLLNLYVHYAEDPNRYTAYQRANGAYTAKSRYNENNISKLMRKIIDELEKCELVTNDIGFYDRQTNIGRWSRVKATKKLSKLFSRATFSVIDIFPAEHRTSIILRNDDIVDDVANVKCEVEYEDTEETNRMSRGMLEYNKLLRKTFVDIPLNDDGLIVINSSRGKRHLLISQSNKFVRRIFSRGSFTKNGRFYGGWWQHCPKEHRPNVYINDNPTIEIDFTGLHTVILYAQENIQYWEELDRDPYAIEPLDFIEDVNLVRKVAKSLMLTLLNAKSDEAAYSAFRNDQETGSRLKQLTNLELSKVKAMIEKKHPYLMKYLGRDAGIDLMYKDAQISEFIIREFVRTQNPILCMHDSYIVEDRNADYLAYTMRQAFTEISGVPFSRKRKPNDKEDNTLKYSRVPLKELEEKLAAQWVPYDGVARQEQLNEEIRARKDPIRSERYKKAWELFQKTYYKDKKERR